MAQTLMKKLTTFLTIAVLLILASPPLFAPVGTDPEPVPEAGSTLALFGVALGGILAFRKILTGPRR